MKATTRKPGFRGMGFGKDFANRITIARESQAEYDVHCAPLLNNALARANGNRRKALEILREMADACPECDETTYRYIRRAMIPLQ